MKNKFKKSTKVLLLSLIVIIGLFSIGSIVVRADDHEDDGYEYSKEYKDGKREEEKENKVHYKEEAAPEYLETVSAEQMQFPVAPPEPKEIITYEEIVGEIIEEPQLIEEEKPIVKTKVQDIPDQLLDSDNDGVPDSLDQHPGEDDLIYAVKDVNEDGITDDFAYLANSIYGNIR